MRAAGRGRGFGGFPRRTGSGGGALVVVLIAIGACRGPATPATTTGVTVDVAAAACARIASCSHSHDPPRQRSASACVDWWLSHGGPTGDAVACLRSAADCKDVDRCVHGVGDPRAVAFCSAHPGTETACVGTSRVACGEDDANESTRTDCASFGAACAELKSQGGLLSYACVDPKRCPPDASSARCDGNDAVVSCFEGSIERTVCGPRTTCHEHTHEDGARFAGCASERDIACEDVGARCEGDVLLECEASGHFGRAHVTSCADLGLVCEASPERKGASCVARQVQCTSGTARCDGDALTFCAAGRKARVDCSAIGMGPCDPDAHGLEAGCKVANDRALR